jgi:hypothetical protein
VGAYEVMKIFSWGLPFCLPRAGPGASLPGRLPSYAGQAYVNPAQLLRHGMSSSTISFCPAGWLTYQYMSEFVAGTLTR